ncbi:MAG TPA: SAM-dependent methyltransferase [Streptosporangiaceae bacterium]|nr:SAM-dependent methyltransferase [Streptosporangiaceae bacterium]
MSDQGPDVANTDASNADLPTAAGMYDYYLGGTNNTAAERAAAEQIIERAPEIRDTAWANRGFLGRAVRWMAAEQGIRQFIDIGAGFPTQRSTHDVAHKVDPGIKVVYSDSDARVVARGLELLENVPGTAAVQADLRDPEALLTHPATAGLIDFAQPVGLLVVAVTHFIPDADDPWGLVRRYVAALAPGSFLALSAGTNDHNDERKAARGTQVYSISASPFHWRTKSEFERFFEGLEIVPPYPGAGPEITFLGLWGCEDPEAADTDGSRWGYAAVGRKP